MDKFKELRNIKCALVLEDLGYNIIQEKNYIRCKLEANNKYYNLLINEDNKFFDNNYKFGGFGSIDLLVKVLQFDFKDVINYLSLLKENLEK